MFLLLTECLKSMEERKKEKEGEERESLCTREAHLSSTTCSLFALFPRKLRPILAFLVCMGEKEREVERGDWKEGEGARPYVLVCQGNGSFSIPYCHGTVIQIEDEG